MRKSGWITLAVTLIVAAHAHAWSKGPARPRQDRTAPPPAGLRQVPAQLPPVETIEGTGKNRAVAEDDAALRARAKVEDLLKKRLGETGWKRRPHQLEPAYLEEMGVLVRDGEPRAEARPDQAVVVARYKVGLTRRYLDAILMDVVEGFGKTPAAASEQAALHAREHVERLLLDRYGQNGWSPPPSLLEPERLARLGAIAPDGEPTPDSRINGGIVARYRVALTDELHKAVQQAARGERMIDRHAIVLRLLAGAVVLLLVTTGYLRLEDMTRGYATALLRGAAAAIILLAGLGLFLTI